VTKGKHAQGLTNSTGGDYYTRGGKRGSVNTTSPQVKECPTAWGYIDKKVIKTYTRIRGKRGERLAKFLPSIGFFELTRNYKVNS